MAQDQDWNVSIDSVLAILDVNNKPVGAGFLVAKRIVVTCAHAIIASGSKPGESVSVRFHGSKEDHRATILKEYWDEAQDVAFLQLQIELAELPRPIRLCISGETINHQVKTFGYPEGHINGLNGSGTVTGILADENDRPLIQLDSGEISRSFSGAPLWDENFGSVIGMITSVVKEDSLNTLNRVAFAIPTETLGRVCLMMNEFIDHSPGEMNNITNEAEINIDQKVGSVTGGSVSGAVVNALNSVVNIYPPASEKSPRAASDQRADSRIYKVFLASPNDVLDERRVALEVIDQLNGEYSRTGQPYRIEVRVWDRHSYPDLGLPMDVISKKIPIEECDILVSVFWRRMGTKPNKIRPSDGKPYLSGTEQEVDEAIQARRASEKGRPVIMIYRKMDPSPSQMSEEDYIQYGELLKYFKNFDPDGEHPATVMKFEKDDFRGMLSQHLKLAVADFEDTKNFEHRRREHVSEKFTLPKTVMTGPMGKWLERVGLRDNPFRNNIADYEQFLPQIFVEPSGFPLAELWDYDGPILTYAKRGLGKTALRRFLAEQCFPKLPTSDLLGIEVGRRELEEMIDQADGYLAGLQPVHFAQQVVRLGLQTIETRISGMKAQDRSGDHLITMRQLALESRDDLIHFTSLPAEALNTSIANAFLSQMVALANTLGFRHVIYMVDQVDEPTHLENAPERIAMLLPALLSPSLREASGIRSRYFLPDYLAAWVNGSHHFYRPDRCHIYHIRWKEQDLIKLISERLVQYSEGLVSYQSLRQLCDQEEKLAQDIEIELVRLARGCPRVAIWLVDKLFHIHCEVEKPLLHIQAREWQRVKFEWDTRDQDQFFPSVSTSFPLSQSPSFPGSQVLRLTGKRIFVGDRELILQHRYHAILVSLLAAQGEVRSKNELAQAASPGETPAHTDRGVSDAIRRLKVILHENGVDPGCIETVRGRGYRIESIWAEMEGQNENGYEDNNRVARTEEI